VSVSQELVLGLFAAMLAVSIAVKVAELEEYRAMRRWLGARQTEAPTRAPSKAPSYRRPPAGAATAKSRARRK
jgi:hypothetical protein